VVKLSVVWSVDLSAGLQVDACGGGGWLAARATACHLNVMSCSWVVPGGCAADGWCLSLQGTACVHQVHLLLVVCW
jgi:hypothetical protein